MPKKIHWRLHCWESKTACGKISGVDNSKFTYTCKIYNLSDSWDNVDCKACLNYITKATQ
jgi:hypothetical protein